MAKDASLVGLVGSKRDQPTVDIMETDDAEAPQKRRRVVAGEGGAADAGDMEDSGAGDAVDAPSKLPRRQGGSSVAEVMPEVLPAGEAFRFEGDHLPFSMGAAPKDRLPTKYVAGVVTAPKDGFHGIRTEMGGMVKKKPCQHGPAFFTQHNRSKSKSNQGKSH